MTKPNDDHRKMHLNGHAHLLTGAVPNVPGPEFRVVQLKAGEKLWGVILSPSVWGVHTHWDSYRGPNGRSMRCTRDKLETCEGCEKELPTRWKGYVHFLDVSLRKEAFLEMTPASFDQLMLQAPAKGDLRGLKLEAERSKGGNQGRLKVSLGLWHGEINTLPAPRDPEPTLELLWNWRPAARQG